MKLNKDQREGFAKISDNLATAFLLGGVFGFWVEGKFGISVAVALLIMASFSIILGMKFRAQRSENAN